MSEIDIQKSIMKYLCIRQIYCWRNNTGRRGTVQYGKKGSADIIGLLPSGKFLAIEVKTATGKQSEVQAEFQNGIEGNNGVYILARSTDDLQRQLIPYMKVN